MKPVRILSWIKLSYTNDKLLNITSILHSVRWYVCWSMQRVIISTWGDRNWCHYTDKSLEYKGRPPFAAMRFYFNLVLLKISHFFSKWLIQPIILFQVTQIECCSELRAPQGCTQYFYGSNSQTVRSYNFNAGAGLHLG